MVWHVEVWLVGQSPTLHVLMDSPRLVTRITHPPDEEISSLAASARHTLLDICTPCKSAFCCQNRFIAPVLPLNCLHFAHVLPEGVFNHLGLQTSTKAFMQNTIKFKDEFLAEFICRPPSNPLSICSEQETRTGDGFN